jgi:hypothetical protein
VERPKNVIRTKWVFRNKQDEHGVVTRNKARLIDQEFTQIEGLDFGKTYSLIGLWQFDSLLAFVAHHNFKLYQMDMKNALLNALSKLVYVEQPLGFEDPKIAHHVYKLNKAI